MTEPRRFAFENLEAYKIARVLVRDIYRLQNKFPKEERFALGDQIRRSSTSITSNIAEGSGRNSIKEKIHFVEIAFGSMTESFSQLQNAQDLGYITEDEVEALDQCLIMWQHFFLCSRSLTKVS